MIRSARRRVAAPCLALLALIPGCKPSPPPAPAAPPDPPRGPAPIRVSADPWVISVDRWEDEFPYRGAYLGNGYLGQRLRQSGSGVSGTETLPAFVAGFYVQEKLVALPPLLPLRISSGSHTFGADPAQVTSYRQELRLREGVLFTRATWDFGQGPVDLELETVMLRQQPDVALLRARLRNRSGAAVRLDTLAPEFAGATVKSAQIVGAGGNVPTAATYPGRRIAYTTAFQPLDPTDLAPVSGGAGVSAYDLPAGQTATFALATHVDAGATKPRAALAQLPRLTTGVVAGWLAGHRAAWKRLWQADIEIDGDPEAQEIVRACLFQLFSSVRADIDAGVPPMGLSDAAFNGHVFWDMDSWMLPALLPQHPEVARAMLEYRFRTLEGATANARAEKLPGASYAWESAATGRETLPGAATFSRGRHVTGDIALAARQYFAATNDRSWLQSRAWPILRPTADNWVARARPEGSGFVIKQVSTPDELAGLVDHSAWTQHTARVNLEFAAETAQILGQPANPRWAQVAKGLTYLRDKKTGLILPYAGFAERTAAKQADVLLLEHPGQERLPAAELGRMYDYYAPRVIKNGPAMTDAIHAIIAARLGRDEEALRRFQESYRPFVRPPYHLFSEKPSRDNLCFLTGAAGVVEAVLYGFAGLRLEQPVEPQTREAPERPRLEPHLPASWKALRLRSLQWRGKAWDVELKPGAQPAWTPAARS